MIKTTEATLEAQDTPARTVAGWLEKFNAALESQDAGAAAELFAHESFWRDLVAMSWNIVTVEGPAGVRGLLDARSPTRVRATSA